MKSQASYPHVGHYLRNALENSKITRKQLAHSLQLRGIAATEPVLARWLSGKVLPNERAYRELLEVLGVHGAELQRAYALRGGYRAAACPVCATVLP